MNILRKFIKFANVHEFEGGWIKSGPKIGPKLKKDQAARPLVGAEVLVAVRGPSPGEGGGKKRRAEICFRQFDLQRR